MRPSEIHEGLSLNGLDLLLNNVNAPISVQPSSDSKFGELPSATLLEETPDSLDCVHLAAVDRKKGRLEAQLLHSLLSFSEVGAVVVQDHHRLDSARQRNYFSEQVCYEVEKVVAVGGVTNRIVEAFALEALTKRSVDSEAGALVLHASGWNLKPLLLEVPTLLLHHIGPKGRLVNVDDWLVIDNSFGQVLRILHSPVLESEQVVSVRKVLVVACGAPDAVAFIEESQFVSLHFYSVLLPDFLASLGDAEVGPVLEASC